MKNLIITLILLLATTATAQQLIYVLPQPPAAPAPPIHVAPYPVIEVQPFVPVPQPRQGVVTDQEGNRFHFQETAPQSGAYWVFPMQSKD